MRLRLLATTLTAAAAAGIGFSTSAMAATVPAPNLAVNPSLEQVTGSTPTCWSVDTGTLTTSTNAHTGALSGYSPAATGTGTKTIATSQDSTCAIPATPGHTYAFSAYYQADTAPSVQVFLRNSTGTWSRWTGGSNLPTATTAWAKAGFTTSALPTGTTALSFGLRATAATNLYLDDASVTDQTPSTTTTGTVLWQPTFPATNQLLTNAYSYWNPTHTDATLSKDWQMTSGSLFARNGNGYSGTVDAGDPDALSAVHTQSAVFRLNSTRYDFGNVRIDMNYRIDRQASTSSTPAVDWDGLHIWMRYQSEYNLYYASIARRDGHIVIKKKCPGGPSNGGTYYELSPEYAGYPITLGAWAKAGASVVNNANGTVTIGLYENGKLAATDTGVGCAPITHPGAVGIRGDNSEFDFNTFTVTAQ